MDLDDIRAMLYTFAQEISVACEERGTDVLSDDSEVEDLIEEFITNHDDMFTEVMDAPEESY